MVRIIPGVQTVENQTNNTNDVKVMISQSELDEFRKTTEFVKTVKKLIGLAFGLVKKAFIIFLIYLLLQYTTVYILLWLFGYYGENLRADGRLVIKVQVAAIYVFVMQLLDALVGPVFIVVVVVDIIRYLYRDYKDHQKLD